MIRWIKAWALWLAASAMLVACGGGGGDSGDCVFCGGGTGSNAVADLIISGVPTTLANGSTEPIAMTVTAVNSSNQVVADAAVTITADNGGVVVADSSTTDSGGQVTASVGIGNDTTPRTITLTVTSGSVTRTRSFQVVEGAGGGDAEMVIALSSQTVTATSPATVTVTVRDATGAVVPSAVVSFTSVRGLGTFSTNSALTNAQGQASVALYPATSSTSGADEVSATTTVDGAVLTAVTGFQITATEVSIASFTSDLVAGTSLSAYGQTNLTVTLSGASAGTPVALSIVSLCANKTKATITPTTQTTTNGVASFTYKDAQCGATEDNDTVQVTITGTTTTSSLSIPLAKPTASSLGFVSASPETIYLKNSGFTETSTVTFLVKDEAGNPLPGKSVVLEPTTLAGGLTMDGGTVPVTKLSDSNGQVTVRINSGTVPTPVRIRATLSGTNIATVSSSLSVAVGLPSQLNFSLSQGTINIEGMNHDGTHNTYTIYASDRLGNPVPAGTAINFVTEGGQVQASKQITVVDGIASATANFASSDPRPANGRVTVLAYALGEESFLDTNGDNIFTAATETFQDLGDVFLSRSFTSTYDSVQDQFISLGITGTKPCKAVDPLKDPSGLLTLDQTIPTVGASTCDGEWGRAYVRRATETVFSTSASRLMWNRAGAGQISGVSAGIKIDSDCAKYSIPGDSGATGDYFLMGRGSLYSMPAQGSLQFVVSDENGVRLNPMPAGTTLSVRASTGITVSVGGGSPVANTSSATSGSVLYQFSDAASGSISISTTSPLGLVTTYTFDITTSTTAPSGAACTQ